LNAGNAQGLVLDRSIVSDIYMPGMSGFELLPKARAARPDVPIIMTASASQLIFDLRQHVLGHAFGPSRYATSA
jgi:CheY-like chemotaxis protein